MRNIITNNQSPIIGAFLMDNKMTAPLISCQRYLDQDLVIKKANQFNVFIIHVFETTLRGRRYRILIDGHHNYAAAKLANKEVITRPPPKKFMRIVNKTSALAMERFLINNITDTVGVTQVLIATLRQLRLCPSLIYSVPIALHLSHVLLRH